MENAVALFGSFDSNIKLIEREFGVKITCRGSELKIEGDAENTSKARSSRKPSVKSATAILSPKIP